MGNRAGKHSQISQENTPVTLGMECDMLANKMNSPILPSSQSPQSLWLTLARVLQVAIICLTIGLFIISIPFNYEQRSTICKTEPCPSDQLTLASVKALNSIGMSVHSLVAITIASDILVAATYTICAVVIFVRKPN
jgi:hypothetical protein